MKTQQKQECIPVGCASSAAVVVWRSGGGGWVRALPGRWGCLPRNWGCLPGGGGLPKGVCVCLGGVSALGV